MSGFILFMMFFVSPPAAPGKQVWSLHNTEHLEFASMDACKKYGLLMQARFENVATVKLRGWCVNQQTGASTYDVKNPHLPLTNGDIYEIPTDVHIDDPKEGY
jgi:hypothetical protein